MNSIEFFLTMDPPTATYQEKKVNWEKRKFYDDDRVVDARAKLRAHLAQHRPDQPLKGPIRMTITWGFRAKGNHRFNTWCTNRPDLDNLQKALQDVMTELGYWKDDAHITELHTSKMWTWHPGIFISLEELPEDVEASYAF